MADQNLKLKIKQEVQTSPLRELQAEMRKIGVEQQKLFLNGEKNSKTFQDNASKINTLKNSIKDLQGVSKGFSGKSPLSGFQLLEAGENLTVVATGLRMATQQAISFGKELFSIARDSAEVKVLYEGFERISGSVEGANKNLETFRKASTGNLSDAELIKFSNSMSSLGYSTETTAKILDIAEKQGDKVGVTFETANASLQKFITTGAKRGLIELGLNVGVVSKEMERLSGLTSKQISELDELEQQNIRTTAVTNLYGDSLDNINKKVGDNADRLASLNTKYENLKLIIGTGLASAFVNLSGGIDSSSASLGNAISRAEGYGRQVAEIIKLISNFSLFGIGKEFTSVLSGDGSPTIQGINDFIENTKKIQSEIQGIGNSVKTGLIPPEFNIGGNLKFDQSALKDLFPNTYGGSTNTGTSSKTGSSNVAKEIDYISDKFKILSNDLTDIQRNINTLVLPESLTKYLDITAGVGTVEGGLRNNFIVKPIAETFDSEKLRSTFDLAISESTNIANILTGGADNFASKFINSIEQGASLLNSFFGILNSVLGIGSGGLFGFLGGIFGGGGASAAGRLLSPSGQVNNSALSLQTIGVPYIIGTEIKGTNLKHIIRKVDNMESQLLVS